jgi:hypothetical protein
VTIENLDILKLVAEFVLADGTIAQNIMHFLADFTDPQTDVGVLNQCENYVEDLYDALDTYIDADVSVNAGTLHVMVFDSGESKWVTDRLVGYYTPDISFQSTGDPLPNQIAPVLVANTLRPKTRGRKFLLPLADDAADGSDWVTAVITALTTSLNHLIADQSISTGNVLSPGVPRVGVDSFQEFTDGVVNSIVGTQRRRKPGVGG